MPRTSTNDTALLDVEAKPETAKPDEKDNGLRTVVYGYGNIPRTKKHYVAMHGAQLVEFEGGIARHVPKELAELMLHGTLPESEKKKGRETPHGRIKCLLLPDEATEADVIKATGTKPLSTNKLAAFLEAADIDDLIKALGTDKATGIAKNILRGVAKE